MTFKMIHSNLVNSKLPTPPNFLIFSQKLGFGLSVACILDIQTNLLEFAKFAAGQIQKSNLPH